MAAILDYQKIVEGVYDAIIVTRQHIITYCNARAEEIFGRSAEELSGKPLDILFSTTEQCLFNSGTNSTKSSKLLIYSGEAKLCRGSNQPFDGWYAGKPLHTTATNAIDDYVWVFHETTNTTPIIASTKTKTIGRKEAELHQQIARLEVSNRMLQAEMQARRRNSDKQRSQHAEMARIARINTAGEMVSALAHELGQPLAAMLNYTHGCLLRLATGNATNEELRQGLIQAVHNAEQAGEIVRRVRRFLQKTPPDRKPHNVTQIVQEIVVFLMAEARRKDVTLRVRGSPPPILNAVVDRVEFEQVIVNLVKNAIEAMSITSGHSKQIELCCLDNGQGMITIAVADNGPGVPKHLRESIFEPFFTTKDKGIGFGLAICSSLIESHGGRLRVGDSWLGGALFEVSLPAEEMA